MTMSPLLARLPSPPRKIAVLRASRLGDFVCATPALRALRAAVPQAEITMITLPLLRDLAARSPHVDRFVAFPGFPGIAQQFFNAHQALEFFQRMQAERFDLAIQLQGSGVYANPFTLMLGATATAGFVRAEDEPSRLDAALVWPDRGHEIRRLLALMRLIGVEPREESLAFPLLDEDRRAATELLAGLPRPLIGLHAGSHDPLRRWPPDRFATVARTLVRSCGGTVVLLGGLHDSDAALELAAAIGPGAYNLVGRTSLGVLGAVIAEFALLITNDSGPAHVAFALRTPTVTIYRAGGTERYGPLLPGPFAALEPITEGHDATSGLVTVAQVLLAADRLLSPPAPESEQRPCPPNELVQYAR
jgi:ADP-heptose:LPS heptosyltransferase